MCRSMVNIQSPTAEIRRGNKKRRKKETGWKYIWFALLHRATITNSHSRSWAECVCMCVVQCWTRRPVRWVLQWNASCTRRVPVSTSPWWVSVIVAAWDRSTISSCTSTSPDTGRCDQLTPHPATSCQSTSTDMSQMLVVSWVVDAISTYVTVCLVTVNTVCLCWALNQRY